MFKSKSHETNFLKGVENVSKSDYATLATVYLLSSDTRLWSKTKDKFREGYVDLSCLNIPNLSRNSYALLSCAKDLELGTDRLLLSDLVDSEVISDQLFKIIINALKIYREGICMTK